MRFEKGEKSLAKGGLELWLTASKCMRLTIYTTETDVELVSCFSVDQLNHTLVGGVSVNSLCQQDGLFALSVNRHSEKRNALQIKLFIWLCCEHLQHLLLN